MKSWLKVVIVMIFAYVLFMTPCFWDDNSYPACTSLLTNYREILYTDTRNKSVKSLTINFCEKVSSLKCMDSSAWELSPDYFDASQSIFLSILCDSVLRWAPYAQTKEYLNKSWFVDFWIITSTTWYNEKCHWYGSMNSCDYAYSLPLIFNKIMNDFFSIKQARFFWINKLDEEFDATEYANNFSKEYFVWLEICKDDSVYYKTTCKKLKNYMTDARNLLKNTEVINVLKLREKWKDFDCNNHRTGNIAYCGLLWSKSDNWYTNTIYNEYYWYNLFLTYYSINIEGTDFLDGSYSNDSDKVTENAERIALVQDQLQKSKKAITLSLRTLAEITDSFPLHVWFLMYQDDALIFMEELAKIYPPIRTLYDKLRNVQIKES